MAALMMSQHAHAPSFRSGSGSPESLQGWGRTESQRGCSGIGSAASRRRTVSVTSRALLYSRPVLKNLKLIAGKSGSLNPCAALEITANNIAYTWNNLSSCHVAANRRGQG